MLVNRVKLDHKNQPDEFNKIVIHFGLNGEFLSKELVDTRPKARAYKIIDGEEVVFKIYHDPVEQNYEAPLYSVEQNKQYKDALYSKEGLRLLNRLKNMHLIQKGQCRRILETANVHEKLIKKIDSILFRKMPMRRVLNFIVEDTEFNRIPFKDLGIDKDTIMQFFTNQGLIYGKA